MKRGFSLLEVALALMIGLGILAASAFSYRQHLQSTKVTRAKLLLSSVRQGISMSRFRTGSYPVLGTNYVTTPSLRSNTDDLGRPFFDLGKNGSVNQCLIDPLYPEATGSPIMSGATASWGGWIYNANTGDFRPNLPAADFPGDPPDRW